MKRIQKGVESYVHLDKDLITTIVKTRDISKVQGGNILITYDVYDKRLLLDFFGLTLMNINKVILEKKDKQYYLVAQQFETNNEEPYVLISVHEILTCTPENLVWFMFDDSL